MPVISRHSSSDASIGTTTSALQSVVNAAADIAANSKSTFRKEAEDRLIPNILVEDRNVEKKIMLLVVIGGITTLEIAAVRYLSQDPSFPFKIIVATTKVMNGSSFLSSMEHIF